jgi:asparagine synthase (glutamine-hydrolysing)
MADVLRHRGPDDEGVWAEPDGGIGLSHRRLAVIDTTTAGRQPMVSASGRSVLVYNGEIYNFRTLRDQLETQGVSFRSGTDTEVLLEACERWGVETAATRLVGMFAFAFWDGETRTLKLVRDRLGIKPLYWASFKGEIAFASELRSLRRHPLFAGEVDRQALTLYLRRNCIPAPHTIYEGISKLEPGAVLTVNTGGATSLDRFWSLEATVRAALTERTNNFSDAEALELVEAQLATAVGDRMIADVPLGAFLSGGIDSSAVVALMQRQSSTPVRTFSLGFPDIDHDEAPFARSVAAHLGTDHTEAYVTAAEALEVIPRLPELFDEPFGDSSQVPTYLVSRLARSQVTVTMSGDGGDEVFAGYNRHRIVRSRMGRLFELPLSVRRGMRSALLAVPSDTWDKLVSHGPRRLRGQRLADNLHKLACVLEADGWGDVHERLASHWQEPANVVIGGREPSSPFTDAAVGSFLTDPMERMLYLDTLTYLPDDILTKVDRASMSVSLEARVPLLDHRLVELMWRLPPRFRVRGGESKWALRQILYRYVPRSLLDRPKHGFGIPIGAWLRGPLRGWAEDLLSPARLAREGYFAPEPIRRLWEDYVAGRGAWQFHLWDVLMFQAWLQHNADKGTDG